MKIKSITCKRITIPLKKSFQTALRSVTSVTSIIVMVMTEDGTVGYGEGVPTDVITGDTSDSIVSTIEQNIQKALIGESIENFERILYRIYECLANNSSAKAAVDMAVYDLFGKYYNIPVYKLLGGYRNVVETDMTISINTPENMERDAIAAVKKGFTTLKIKVGMDGKEDIKRIKVVRAAVGHDVKIRLDANQGWQPKEAIKLIRKLEDEKVDIELVEQPVKAWDLDGLKFVRENVTIPIMADESIFSSHDAFKILKMGAADFLNVKLMKCGGIYQALKIIEMAEVCGVACMVGSMIESKLSITAAAHLAAAKKNVIKVDLDAGAFLAKDYILGGVIVQEPFLMLPEMPGLGIKGLIVKED